MTAGGQNKINHIGERFGTLTVISEEPSAQGRAQWKCLCDCGKEYITAGYNLRQGRKKSCGCRNIKLRGPKNPNWSGHEGISGSVWHSIRSGATHRNLALEITIQDAWALFVEQKERCALTGIKLTFCTSDTQRREKEIEQTASLDRIDSNLGYIPGNIQWVHKQINRMKQNYPQERFIELCILVANKHKGLR